MSRTKNRFFFIYYSKIILLLILFPVSIKSQTGNPNILNISKNEYGGAGQNWSISVDTNNQVYAGNSKGLLIYNGTYWERYVFPHQAPVHSLLPDENGSVYVGSFDEFGCFKSNKYGKFDYISFSNKVKMNNERINNIVKKSDKIYFFSSSSYFVYDEKNITSRSLPFELEFVKNIEEQLYCFVRDKGLGILKNDEFELTVPCSEINNNIAVTILPLDNKYLIPTQEGGLYLFDGVQCAKWKAEIQEYLSGKIISKVIVSNDSLYVLGTINAGVYAFDKTGSLIWKVSTSEGLQNNTVHDICFDNRNNIWAALDDRISYIENTSGIHFIQPYKENIGSVYSCLFSDKYIYLATNQGLFFCKKEEKEYNFRLIPNLSGKANSINIFDNQIICSHSNGTYLIEDERAVLLSDIKEASIIKKATIHQQEVLIQTASKSLNIYKKNYAGQWRYSHSIGDFLFPIRRMEVDVQGNIWISHYYKGLFSVKLNQDLTETAQENLHSMAAQFFKESNNINLFKMKGRVIFGNNQNYYTYDDINNVIVPYSLHTNHLPYLSDIQKVINIDDNNYWCITDKRIFKLHDTGTEMHIERYIPYSYFGYDLPDYDRNIIRTDNKTVFCLNNKIAILDDIYDADMNSNFSPIQIASVESFSASDTISLELNTEITKTIQSEYNNLLFKISFNTSPVNSIEYIYKLDGLENDFSGPTPNPAKEYNHLHSGKYTFHAAACDHLGNKLSEISYEFEIEPPFYKGTTAIIIYAILIVLLGICIYSGIKKLIKRSNKKIAEKQEKEIIKLKNDNLQSELYFKSKEMANSTFLLINKNNILREIKNELDAQKEELGSRYPEKYYSKLSNIIESGIDSEDNWSVFQSNFDRIHENFFRNLKEKYPELTANDLRICALLRLNLSTKDIANFLGNTTRGVDSARYRLRKKLQLDSEIDIVEFLIQFSGGKN